MTAPCTRGAELFAAAEGTAELPEEARAHLAVCDECSQFLPRMQCAWNELAGPPEAPLPADAVATLAQHLDELLRLDAAFGELARPAPPPADALARLLQARAQADRPLAEPPLQEGLLTRLQRHAAVLRSWLWPAVATAMALLALVLLREQRGTADQLARMEQQLATVSARIESAQGDQAELQLRLSQAQALTEQLTHLLHLDAPGEADAAAPTRPQKLVHIAPGPTRLRPLRREVDWATPLQLKPPPEQPQPH